MSLVEQIEKSQFQFAELQIGDLKLTLSKGESAPVSAQAAATASSEAASMAQVSPLAPVAPLAKAPPAVVAPPVDGVPVSAPVVGRFYAHPEPGRPPFVTIGEHVESGTTVGLIEVMKVFTAVMAGVRGTVKEICVRNEEFVEHGQCLLIVEPDEEGSVR